MYVAEVRLSNFRSYRDARFRFAPGLNIVVGPNASGKTNLLEGMCYALRAASPRTARDDKLLRFEAQHLRVEARLDDGSRTEVLYGDGNGRRIRVNDREGSTADELRCRAALFVFVPESLLLVKGAPARRRAHVDSFGSSLDVGYAAACVDVQLALRQRNAQLARVRGGAPEKTLDPWDAQLARAGSLLSARRRWLVDHLRPAFGEYAAALTPAGGTYDLTLRSVGVLRDGDEAAYLALLRERRWSDVQRGMSCVGPHRDDVVFTEVGVPGAGSEGRDLRLFGSQGEQRAAVLALLLAERRVASAVAGHEGPLLLDDVMSELDEYRRRLLVDRLLEGGQAVITTTTTMYFTPAELANAHVVELPPPGSG